MKVSPSFIASVFPPVRFAIAYGSAVFAQPGNTPDMIDLIFAVENPTDWHAKNLHANPQHYSSLRHLGPRAIAAVQQTSAQMYFNPYVTLPDGLNYKYGVITVDDLLRDLRDWAYLYAGGRLHKPVEVIVPHLEIQQAMLQNLQTAVSIAMLLLPSEFSEWQLYHEIALLSYRGDTRMSLSVEDPRKAEKIVTGNFQHFCGYYSRTLGSAPFLTMLRRLSPSPNSNSNSNSNSSTNSKSSPTSDGKNTLWRQDITLESCNLLLQSLPKPLQAVAPPIQSSESVAKGLEQCRRARADALTLTLAKVVRWYSFGQTAKGLLTAGVGRSTVYATRKIKIGWNASRK